MSGARPVEASADGVVLTIRVIPRASKPGLAGVRDEALLVRIAAAPVEGAANAELIETLADAFGVARRQVSILSGDRSRQKRVRITGLTETVATEVVARAGTRG